MKILVADDDPVEARVLQDRLSAWGYEIILVNDGRKAWEILHQSDGPKLAILDWMMPGLNGVEVCRLVREQIQEPYIYILLLTSREKESDVVAGLEAGADDYLTKPFRPLELKSRLGAGQRILALQEQLIEAREELKVLATHDALTGIWNRRAILDFLQGELSRCERHGLSLGVVMGDLDHFKQINDTFGHIGGDAVLSETAFRIKNSIRPYDAVGRYGGEEFLIVVPECETSGVIKVAERVCSILRDDPFIIGEVTFPVTISLGVASCRSVSTEQLKQLLEIADQTLYRAKKAGRNRFEVTEF